MEKKTSKIEQLSPVEAKELIGTKGEQSFTAQCPNKGSASVTCTTTSTMTIFYKWINGSKEVIGLNCSGQVICCQGFGNCHKNYDDSTTLPGGETNQC